MGDTVLQIDGDRSRTEVASTLRALAEQLDRGEEVRLVGDGETIGVRPADELAFELEVEQGSNGDREIEVEIELEWTEPSESPSDAEAASDAEVASEAADELSDAEASPAAPEETDVDKAVPDDAGTIASLARFEVYRDRADEWRWRLVHRNGNIIAASGEGYTTRQNAEKGMRSVMRNAPGASILRGE
ncbi:HVO_2922 family protein [Natronoarchaeum mannanilyticum]|uniref:Amphi-Trp domain-containing protein n=1 Tax=Natronoarchaeum mannanilyticum TaxID=926360 RepID=A0AAV3T6Z7_9EURY